MKITPAAISVPSTGQQLWLKTAFMGEGHILVTILTFVLLSCVVSVWVSLFLSDVCFWSCLSHSLFFPFMSCLYGCPHQSCLPPPPPPVSFSVINIGCYFILSYLFLPLCLILMWVCLSICLSHFDLWFFFCLPLCLSVSACLCHLSLLLSVYLWFFFCLPLCLSVSACLCHLSLLLSVFDFVPVCLDLFSQSVCMSVFLSLSVFLCLTFFMHFWFCSCRWHFWFVVNRHLEGCEGIWHFRWLNCWTKKSCQWNICLWPQPWPSSCSLSFSRWQHGLQYSQFLNTQFSTLTHRWRGPLTFAAWWMNNEWMNNVYIAHESFHTKRCLFVVPGGHRCLHTRWNYKASIWFVLYHCREARDAGWR